MLGKGCHFQCSTSMIAVQQQDRTWLLPLGSLPFKGFDLKSREPHRNLLEKLATKECTR
jgi:hypothetical protein